MGRSKAAPVHRQHDAETDDEVLGRRTLQLDSDHASSVHVMLAAEIEHDRAQLYCDAISEDEIEDEIERSSNRDRRVQFAVEGAASGEQDADEEVVPSNQSRLSIILARIEREEAAKASNKRQKSVKPPKKQRRNKAVKSVSFAAEDDVTVIPPPEIQIVHCDEENNDLNGGPSQTVMLYYSRGATTTNESSNNNNDDTGEVWWLGVLPLSRNLRVVVQPNETDTTQQQVLPPETPLPVVTKQGAIDVWNLVQDCKQSSSVSLHRKECTQAMGRAVQAGTVCLELVKKDVEENGIHLRVGITIRALQLCNRDQLPLQSRQLQRRGKQFRASFDVHMALAALFPESEIADTVMHHQRREASPITAKQVYALTDNVQLRVALDRKQPSEPLSIPGLTPTLRPYQATAVEWMIQREKGEGNNESSIEWELAWFVLLAQHKAASDDKAASAPSMISLSKWRRDHAATSGNANNLLLFCPFTGWLAESIEQARNITVGPVGGGPPSATKGGILAESMGLGKTVEVLACILAHPYVPPEAQSSIAHLQNVASPARRQLDFSEASTSAANIETDKWSVSSRTTGYVGDVNEFGDAEDESDDDRSDAGLIKIVSGSPQNGVTSSSTAAPMADSGPTQISGDAVPVTPVKDDLEVMIEERWTDDDIVGACICGDLIGFSSTNGPGSVVVCISCNEPMHAACAAFSSVDEMKAVTKPLRFRQRFSNFSLDCRVCEKEWCPCCVAPQESGATLIVTPAAILNQWEREIQRHTRRNDLEPLRVVVYEGIKRLAHTNSVKRGSPAIKYMHPGHLADADIVLMTFDALMSDLGHTDDNHYVSRGSENESGGNLRKRKRYRVVPSPLLSIKWWRVCLDEAQRVETPTAGSAQMALKLEATHRWCISGTPVGRGKLDDLYGLLLFLRLDPFWNKPWFRKCFNPSYRNIEDRIKHLLDNVFWRSTKNLDLVREQMGVPEQIEKKILLQFSSIEKHFYNRQLEQTLSVAVDVADRERQSAKRKSSHLHLLTDHLHKLRAACCHPQVGSSGIGAVKRSRTAAKRSSDEGDVSLSSRVMTMGQILDKFIDDAKIQCEESQRLAVLHTNGMAVTSKLKVEAKQRGVSISESDRELLEKSCELYMQSLRLADENAVPTLVLGESLLGGSVGFRSPQKIVQKCSFCMDWKWPGAPVVRDTWAKFDFTLGPARKITQLRVRTRKEIPKDLIEDASADFEWHLLYPKDCVFQCLSASGEFVHVHSFSMELPGDEDDVTWTFERGFRTNKSKSWRIVVESFHTSRFEKNDLSQDSNACGAYMGIDAEFYEATIASDPLQRLHCLHNASLSFSSLLELQESAFEAEVDTEQAHTVDEVREKIDSMTAEATKIESLYLDAARAIHNECHRRLEESSTVRIELERDLLDLSRKTRSTGTLADCWDDSWWDDFLVMCHLFGSEAQQHTLCDKLLQDLDGVFHGGLESADRTGNVAFPVFGDITGLRTALQMRIRDIRSGLGNKSSRRSQTKRFTDLGYTVGKKDTGLQAPREGRFLCAPGGHGRCMQSILDLTPNPSDGEMLENSRCKICKADWFQTGPMCRHCKIGEELEDLTPDKVTMLLLSSLHSLLKGNFGSSLLKSSRTTAFVVERAKKFFDLIEAVKKEKSAAWRLWRTHLDLLNDLDELNQCKSAMRLTFEDEDVTALTEDQLNAVVVPVDIKARYHDHAAKQAMALGTLSRAKGTLQYLKNQSAAEHQTYGEEKDDNAKDETCIVCLSAFDTDRAVLRCGHSFHLSPCLEKLRSRSGGSHISCPLRCRVRTDPKDVMIASEGKRHDDGSHSKRRIKGSYGTKVTRLVGDILDVCDMGDKSLVFSQWDDMLDICEQALAENGVQFVRVASLRQIGDCTRRFREPDCSVMLLNVKNGAEGLTLLEATHVFMIEPLLNCGLDSQAINRTHRIGQNRKTYVWRYIVLDTVEVKIDKLRTEHEEDQLEDLISDGKKSVIKAGGIDGGFQSQEELLDILHP